MQSVFKQIMIDRSSYAQIKLNPSGRLKKRDKGPSVSGYCITNEVEMEFGSGFGFGVWIPAPRVP
jgi:hypothetical protein